MGDHKRLFVEKHITNRKLKALIKEEKNERILQRLIFINTLYMNDDAEYASRLVGVSKVTGYKWLKVWNKQGYKGLKPNFGGGRPSKLTKEQKKELKRILKTKKNWLTREVMGLIKREFNVSYSYRQVIRILKGFRMHYSKPYPNDYRRPENAEEILKERLDKGIENAGDDFILGFVDEAHPQTTDNKQRVWSFEKPKIIKNTTKLKANTFGFYPVNGNPVLDFKENSRKESICGFLREIRRKNPEKTIVIPLDNFPSHKAGKVRRCAESLDIILVFLPPYSPDLNPIEQIWRCIRRKISQIFVKSEYSFLETIRTTFYRLAKKTSFMYKWLEIFMPNLLK